MATYQSNVIAVIFISTKIVDQTKGLVWTIKGVFLKYIKNVSFIITITISTKE